LLWTGGVAVRPWFCGWAGLALSVLACLAVGGLGGLFTASSVSTWYPGLSKPSWTPPSGVFAPVWTTLYVTMGVALWLAWRARPESAGACSALFAVQLVLNLAWSVVFFGLRQPGWAVAEIVVLWCAIAATAWRLWLCTPIAGLLMVPYLAWVTFATALTAAIWRMNG